MINRFCVEGRITRDVSLKKTPTGVSVVEFDIGCTRNRRNDQGEFDSDFFRIKVFNKLAEIAEKYGKKGTRVIVDGRLQVRRYEGRDGTQKSMTELIADNISFLQSPQKAAETPPKSEPAQPQAFTQPVPSAPQELEYGGIYDGITEEDMPW